MGLKASYKRRQRHRTKSVLKHGKKSVSKHKAKSGRTGSIFTKHLGTTR